MTRRSIYCTVIVRFAAAILWLASLDIGAEVRASYVTPNPGLPPQGGAVPPGYFGQDPVVYHLPGGVTIELFNVLHSNFTNIVVTTVGATSSRRSTPSLADRSASMVAHLPPSNSREASKWKPWARQV